MPKKLSNLDKVLRELDKQYNKGILLNDDNLYDLMNNWVSTELEDKTIVDQMLSENKIYKSGDKKSYIKLVRDEELISLSEKTHKQNKKIAKKQGHNVVIRDTEFPIDEDGMYIIEDEDDEDEDGEEEEEEDDEEGDDEEGEEEENGEEDGEHEESTCENECFTFIETYDENFDPTVKNSWCLSDRKKVLDHIRELYEKNSGILKDEDEDEDEGDNLDPKILNEKDPVKMFAMFKKLADDVQARSGDYVKTYTLQHVKFNQGKPTMSYQFVKIPPMYMI